MFTNKALIEIGFKSFEKMGEKIVSSF